MKKVRMLLSFILFVFAAIGVSPSRAAALQPRLLWEKTVPFKIGSIKMAFISGDVIVPSREARQVILYDKNGKEVFHWGPRVDREPMGVDISADGSVILYTTTFTEGYLLQKKRPGEWDKRIHYATRKGKELWNKKIWGGAALSPDGKMIAVIPAAGEGEDLTMLDSQGNSLWTFKAGDDVAGLAFSPDSQYIGLQGYGGYSLFDKLGNVLWKKTDVSDIVSPSVSDMAKYATLVSWTDGNRVSKIFDKQGNLVFEGDADVSGDGNRLLVHYPNKVVILSLPDKQVIKEYLSPGFFMSHDGRFLFINLLGVPGRSRIIDTSNGDFGDFDLPKGVIFSSETKDGKYMLIVVNQTKIFYYQLY